MKAHLVLIERFTFNNLLFCRNNSSLVWGDLYARIVMVDCLARTCVFWRERAGGINIVEILPGRCC